MVNITTPEPGGAGGNPLAALAGLAGMSDRGTERLRKVLVSQMIVGVAYKTAKDHLERLRTKRSFTIAVPGDDTIYDALHDWLLAKIPPAERRALAAHTGRSDGTAPVEGGGRRRRRTVQFFYDSATPQVVVLEGHKIKVSIEQEGAGGGAGSLLRLLDEGNHFTTYNKRHERILFTCPTVAARDAVHRFVQDVTEQQHRKQRSPSFYLANAWGDWLRRDELGHRSLDSVVLRSGQAEDLVGDLERFLAAEAAYTRLGLPWHRGYLLSGPPGTGKTSIPKALANYFDLDVHYIPLNDLSADASLMRMISGVDAGSILLLEDIDVLAAAHDREDNADTPSAGRQYGVSLTGLLNSLDGVATPHGLIAFMTSNHPEVLDDALIRPGRVDRHFEIGYVDDDQLARMARTFLGATEPLPPLPAGRQITPAQIVELVKADLEHPERAFREIAALVTLPDDLRPKVAS